MENENLKLERMNRIIGPIDSMIRGGIGLIILICCYTLNTTILEFLVWHVIVCYFWLTGLTGWDPFYAIYNKFWKSFKDKLAIEGRFKL